MAENLNQKIDRLAAMMNKIDKTLAVVCADLKNMKWVEEKVDAHDKSIQSLDKKVFAQWVVGPVLLGVLSLLAKVGGFFKT